MDEQNPAGTGAQDTQDAESTDPFAGFQNEEYAHGERVADAETAAEAPPAEVTPPAAEESTDDSEETDDESEEAPAEGETPRKKTYQERINELTRARREAERRAEEVERRLAAIEAAREEPAAPAAPAPPEPAAPAEGESGPPDPEDFEFGELDSRYITALVDYQTEQRFAAYRTQQEQEAQQRAAEQRQREDAEKFNAQAAKAAEKYPDFNDKVLLGAQRGEWPLSAELGQMLVQSDVGADIAYYLASNPAEAGEVFRQSPTEQARFFGRMEAKFSASQTAAPGTPPAGSSAPPRTPKAPEPVLPARGAGGKFQVSADTNDFSAFERVATQEK